jgi:hypothetical protein
MESCRTARLDKSAARLAGCREMIQITAQMRVLVAIEPVDGRKGIDSLACLMHIFEDNKGLLCYKHVVKTMFAATKEASECLKIAQHSVCCSQEFFASQS